MGKLIYNGCKTSKDKFLFFFSEILKKKKIEKCLINLSSGEKRGAIIINLGMEDYIEMEDWKAVKQTDDS